MWRLFACLWIALIDPVAAEAPPTPARTETVQEALCRLIEASARTHGLPASFLTRLIWRESSFRVSVVSPAGAQGVAQFMPGTAVERGLADPFDPEQAIPKAADLLSSQRQRFGNLGLAAAAYNGGPNRVSAWLEARDTTLAAEWLGLFRVAPFAALGLATVSAVSIIAAPPLVWFARALM